MALLDVDQWAVDHWWYYIRCEDCRQHDPSVHVRPCMTAYADQSKNHLPLLCEVCAGAYFDYWTDRWRDYNSG